MRYTVKLAASAKADLFGIFDYLNDVSSDVAERWMREANAAIGALEDFAGFGPAREAAFLDVPLRQRVFQSYRIVFEVDEADGIVNVLYIRHAAQRTVGEPDAVDEAPEP